MRRIRPSSSAVRPMLLVLALVVGGALLLASPLVQTQAPQQYFGFALGTDGEMARYPKVVEYLEHLAATSKRVKFEDLGKTTMGNRFVLATFSAPENLARLDRLVEINRRLADPRGLTDAEAAKLANVVARYPTPGAILRSGWLLGEDLLRDQANVMAFHVGKGYVVAAASEIDFRTQPRATFKILFNSLFHGASQKVKLGSG